MTARDPDRTSTNLSLQQLLQIWQEWNTRQRLAGVAEKAQAGGATALADPRRRLEVGPTVPAIDVLAAQHEFTKQLSDGQLLTTRAAREGGASWAEIADATATTPEIARHLYLYSLHQEERHAATHGVGFDTVAYLAAAGRWIDELHPDIPRDALEQIQRAVAYAGGDIEHESLSGLRRCWWNPHHRPNPITSADIAGGELGADGPRLHRISYEPPAEPVVPVVADHRGHPVDLAPPPPLPDNPVVRAHTECVIRLMLEVLKGRRPAEQLAPFALAPVLRYLRASTILTSARLYSVRCFQPHEQAAEITAVLYDPQTQRASALAARFDHRRGRWFCSALRLLPPSPTARTKSSITTRARTRPIAVTNNMHHHPTSAQPKR